MSNLCGFIGTVDSTASESALKHLYGVIEHHSDCVTLQNTNSTIIAQRSNTVRFFRNADATIVVVGHINGPHRQYREPMEGLLAAYRRVGPSFLEDCSGQFAVIILLSGVQHAFVGVDRLASVPLFYQTYEKGILFSTLNLDDTGNSEQKLLNLLYFNSGLISNDAKALRPGQAVVWRDGVATPHFYWRANMHGASPAGSFKQREILFKKHLQRATNRYGGRPQVGVLVGEDSPSVYLANILAAQHLSQPLPLFSVDYQGRPTQIRGLEAPSDTPGFNHYRIEVSPEHFIHSLTKATKVLRAPIGYLPALNALFASELCMKNGLNTLLSAQGCKTLFLHSSRYAIRSWGIGGWLMKSWLNVWQSASSLDENLLNAAESGHWLERLGLDSVFTPSFLENCDLEQPKGRLLDTFREANCQTTLGKLQAVNLEHNLSTCQLANYRLVSQVSGISFFFPYLSSKLIAFSLGLKDSWKIDLGRHQAFITRLLSEELSELSYEHTTAPLGLWLHSDPQFKAWVDKLICSMKSHNIFNLSFLDHIIQKGGHELSPHSQDKVLWLLISFALWLELESEHLDKTMKTSLQSKRTIQIA